MTEVPRATLRILIIDDDVMHARVVQRLLQNDGHETLTASSAEAAIQSLDGPSGFLPHAILLDAVLGPKSGLRIIRDLAARCKAPIVVMSGHFDEELRRDALLLGAKAVLGKPLDFKVLNSVLRELVAGA